MIPCKIFGLSLFSCKWPSDVQNLVQQESPCGRCQLAVVLFFFCFFVCLFFFFSNTRTYPVCFSRRQTRSCGASLSKDGTHNSASPARKKDKAACQRQGRFEALQFVSVQCGPKRLGIQHLFDVQVGIPGMISLWPIFNTSSTGGKTGHRTMSLHGCECAILE